MRGNLAPDGAVIKVAGHERIHHTGTARVFESEDACHAAVEAGKINPNDVLVIRYEGPRGGPGMREMLAVTAAIKGIPALSETVALLTDGRFSGATRGVNGRPRCPRSPARRPHRRRPRRRHHYLRHPQPQTNPQRPRSRDRQTPRRMEGPPLPATNAASSLSTPTQ